MLSEFYALNSQLWSDFHNELVFYDQRFQKKDDRKKIF